MGRGSSTILWLLLLALRCQLVPATATFFLPGKEYVYSFGTTATVGTEDYVEAASVFNISGNAHFLVEGNNLTIKLSDLQFGVFNGVFDEHSDLVRGQPLEELRPLEEPFQVELYNEKVLSISFSADTPEWARNIQRGLASALQLDLAAITVNTAESLDLEENTILGKCKTNYAVIPLSNENGTRLTQVRKYRSHSHCRDLPTQAMLPHLDYDYCPDPNSRDVYNSSLWASYDLELKDNVLTLQQIKHGSTALYYLFGNRGHHQYSFVFTSLILDHIEENGQIPGPTNPVRFEDIKYVFEHPLSENEDLTKAQPGFSTPAAFNSDIPETQAAIKAELLSTIKKLVDLAEGSLDAFRGSEGHQINQIQSVSLMALLNYDGLKEIYDELLLDSLEMSIFMDLLVSTGTGPTALVVRDVVKDSHDMGEIMKLLGQFSVHLRNPTEKLVKEFEPLILQYPMSAWEKLKGRLIDLGFTTLLGRACGEDKCKASGLVDHYVRYYSNKYYSSQDPEEKTGAVLALRNIGTLQASETLFEIFLEKNTDRTIRVQALPGVKALIRSNANIVKKHILPVFYDRTQHDEIRALAMKVSLMHGFSPELLNQVVIFLWTDSSPFLRNYVYTLIHGMANNPRPCTQSRAAYARSALSFFPPWSANKRFSAVHPWGYYDNEYSFGQLHLVSGHKDGTSNLPTSMFINVKETLGGYGNSFVSIFLRLEGLNQAFTRVLLSTNYEDIQNVLKQIGVVERPSTPLKLEFALMMNKRFVTYHAAEQKDAPHLATAIQKILQMALSTVDSKLAKLAQHVNFLVERPSEAGFPVQIHSQGSKMIFARTKINSERSMQGLRQDIQWRFQDILNGQTSMSNIFPGLGIKHSVTAFRFLQLRMPVNITLDLNWMKKGFGFALKVPQEADPALLRSHATVFTSYDQYSHGKFAQRAPDLGASSVQVTKGDSYRKSRRIFIHKQPIGLRAGVEYFDCEKAQHSLHVFRHLKKFFGANPSNQEDGKFFQRFHLGLNHLKTLLFLSPNTRTCGVEAYLHQDASQPTVFERMEGQIRVKGASYAPGEEAKSLQASVRLVYEGDSPKSRNYKLEVHSTPNNLFSYNVSVLLGIHDEIRNKFKVYCLDVRTDKTPTPDWYSYTAPRSETRAVRLVYARTMSTESPPDLKDVTCPDPETSSVMNYLRESHQSQLQREEVEGNHWPYSRCEEDRKSGRFPGPIIPPTEACIAAALRQTALREANITIDYRVKHSSSRRKLKYLRALLYAFLEPYRVSSGRSSSLSSSSEESGETGLAPTIPPGSNMSQGKIQIDANFDQDFPMVDLDVLGGEGHLRYQGIDLNFLPFRVLSRHYLKGESLLQDGLFGKCVASATAVETYDNVTIAAELPGCFTLISGDCSSTPMYAVYARKTGPETIALQAQFNQNNVTIEDNGEVSVEGEKVDVAPGTFQFLGTGKSIKITRYDENNLWIQSVGVQVRYTKYHVTLILHSIVRNTNCGICGNFNDNPMDDHLGPDPSCGPLNPQELFRSYVIRDGDCQGEGQACPGRID